MNNPATPIGPYLNWPQMYYENACREAGVAPRGPNAWVSLPESVRHRWRAYSWRAGRPWWLGPNDRSDEVEDLFRAK